MATGKVLLVEDDLFIRDLYAEVLQREGYTVLTAEDGEAGLALGKSNLDASLMLLDIMLPKIHGVEVLKRLKADPITKGLPIVMLTNLTEENIIQETLQLGAYGYLIKVRFTLPQIVEKVKEFIHFHEQHKA